MSKGISGNQILIPGLLAGEDLSAKQWHCVRLASTANEVLDAYTTTHRTIGILQNDPADGEPAMVCALGISRAIAGTALISTGEMLGANSSGVFDTSGGTAGADYFVGRALEAANATGDFITIVVSPGGFFRA